jgi:hypothetical protein
MASRSKSAVSVVVRPPDAASDGLLAGRVLVCLQYRWALVLKPEVILRLA